MKSEKLIAFFIFFWIFIGLSYCTDVLIKYCFTIDSNWGFMMVILSMCITSITIFSFLLTVFSFVELFNIRKN